MFAANQNDPNQCELDPDKFLDGLGLIGWFRLVFQTRVRTIKQCDATVDLLVRAMDAQEAELRNLRRVVALVPALREALIHHHKREQLWTSKYPGSDLETLTENALAPLREVL